MPQANPIHCMNKISRRRLKFFPPTPPTQPSQNFLTFLQVRNDPELMIVTSGATGLDQEILNYISTAGLGRTVFSESRQVP